MNEFTRPVEEFSDSIREYVDLRVDDLKLRTAKGLSISLGQLTAMILVLFAVSIMLLALAFGLILFIGDAIGSYAVGCFIVAGFFALVALIFFAFRKKMFLNGFIRMFVKAFFDKEEIEEDTDEQI